MSEEQSVSQESSPPDSSSSVLGGGGQPSIDVSIDASPKSTSADVQLNDFRSSLSEEYRDKYSEFNSAEDFVKGYDNLATKLGKNPLVKPKEGASESDLSAYKKDLYSHMGVPDDKSGYELKLADDLPDAIKASMTDERFGRIQDIAMEEGVTPQALERIVGEYINNTEEDISNLDKSLSDTYDSSVDNLKDKWGDSYDNKVDSAITFSKEFFPEISDEGSELNLKYGNDPYLIEKFAELGNRLGESKVNHNDTSVPESGDWKSQAAELNRKTYDPSLTYKEQRAAMDQARVLYQKNIKG